MQCQVRRIARWDTDSLFFLLLLRGAILGSLFIGLLSRRTKPSMAEERIEQVQHLLPLQHHGLIMKLLAPSLSLQCCMKAWEPMENLENLSCK